MDNIHISSETSSTATPAGPNPANVPPKHPSPMDQTRTSLLWP